MDAGQVSQLFRSGDWVAVIVIVVPAVAWCAKEMFGAIRARDQRRREFLDLWIRKEHHDDDLWLEGIVLYGYGVTLSAATIRHITSRDKPMQRLRAFAMNHAYFDFDRSRGAIAWRNRRYNSRSRRVFTYMWLLVAYLILVSAGVMCALFGIKSDHLGMVVNGAVLMLAAAASFWRLLSLWGASASWRNHLSDALPFVQSRNTHLSVRNVSETQPNQRRRGSRRRS